MRAPRIPKPPPTPEMATQAPAPAAPPTPKGRGRNPELEAALGARIRALRIAARMSQGDLGKSVGVSFQQVQKYENGKDRITVSTLQGFATALGVHPGTFFDNEIPVPVGPIPDVKAALKAADAVQQIRDPRVLKQLLALARELAKTEADVEQPAPPPTRRPDHGAAPTSTSDRRPGRGETWSRKTPPTIRSYPPQR